MARQGICGTQILYQIPIFWGQSLKIDSVQSGTSTLVIANDIRSSDQHSPISPPRRLTFLYPWDWVECVRRNPSFICVQNWCSDLHHSHSSPKLLKPQMQLTHFKPCFCCFITWGKWSLRTGGEGWERRGFADGNIYIQVISPLLLQNSKLSDRTPEYATFRWVSMRFVTIRRWLLQKHIFLGSINPISQHSENKVILTYS